MRSALPVLFAGVLALPMPAVEERTRLVVAEGDVSVHEVLPVTEDFDVVGQATYALLLREWADDALPPRHPVPEIPWVGEGDRGWIRGRPTFELSQPDTGATAEGWIGMTDRHFLLRVAVREPEHVTAEGDGRVDRGDLADGLAILFQPFGPEIGLKERAVRGYLRASDPERRIRLDGQGLFTLTLTGDGPAVWWSDLTYRHQPPVRHDWPATIERDANVGTTTYELSIPWPTDTAPLGVLYQPDIAVQLMEAGQRIWRASQQWGGGLDNEQDPPYRDGMFVQPRTYNNRRLRLGRPPHPVHVARTISSEIWHEGDHGEVMVATTEPGPLFVEVELDGRAEELSLPASSDGDLRRFAVRAVPRGLEPGESVRLEVRLLDGNGRELVAADAVLAPVFQERLAVEERVAELRAANPDNALFHRHLDSLAEIARQGMVVRYRDHKRNLLVDRLPPDTLDGEARLIHRALRGPAAEWETYLERRASLCLAKTSPDRRCAGYARVWLPRDFDPSRAYPVSIDWFPLFGYDRFELGNTRDNRTIDERIAERRGTDTSGMIAHEHFGLDIEDGGYLAVRPRVNVTDPEGAGYVNLRLAVEAVEEAFVTDPDRWYWVGGSWGSSVQIAIAALWPDRFAAMSPNCMRYWATFFPGVRADQPGDPGKYFELCGSGAERNMAHQAFMFNGTRSDIKPETIVWRQTRFRPIEPRWNESFTRDEDRLLWYYHSPDDRFQINAVDECHEWVNGERKTIFAHRLSAWQSRSIFEWLEGKRRIRPDEFFYIKIGEAGDGAWGVHVRENPDVDPWKPETWERFECRIRGDTVEITSHNTTGISVELGRTPHGRSLGLEGEVTVIWNGEEAYRGPAEAIALGKTD